MTDREVRENFFNMIDGTMNGLFLSRASKIKMGLLTMEEIDEYIKDRASYYMEKYDSMTLAEVETEKFKKVMELISQTMEVDE